MKGQSSRKICLLKNREDIFTKENLDKIANLGELAIWDGKTDMKDFLKGADIIVTTWGSPSLDLSVLDTAPELSFIFHAAGSVKTLVDRALFDKGVRVSSASSILGREVAVTTLGLMLVAVKKIPWWNMHVKDNKGWRDDEKLASWTTELSGINTGVISMSFVGKNLVSLLRGITDNVSVFDPYWSSRDISEAGGKKVETLYNMAENCDVIALCAPLLESTREMIDGKFFRVMKDGAVFVNASRGAIIDENALIAELEKERIFACLDVTSPEPPLPESPLRRLKNVVISPHVAGIVNSGLPSMGRFCAEEIKRFIGGERLLNEITLEKFDITA